MLPIVAGHSIFVCVVASINSHVSALSMLGICPIGRVVYSSTISTCVKIVEYSCGMLGSTVTRILVARLSMLRRALNA